MKLGPSTSLIWLWAAWSKPPCGKTQQTHLFAEEGEVSPAPVFTALPRLLFSSVIAFLLNLPCVLVTGL